MADCGQRRVFFEINDGDSPQGQPEQKKIFTKLSSPWGEDWEDTVNRIKDVSPYKDFTSYRLRPIIVKGGDDLRQELFAMQLIKKFDDIFKQSNSRRLYLKPYEIIITSENSGLIEYCPNTLSMDSIKKFIGDRLTLKQFLINYFD